MALFLLLLAFGCEILRLDDDTRISIDELHHTPILSLKPSLLAPSAGHCLIYLVDC